VKKTQMPDPFDSHAEWMCFYSVSYRNPDGSHPPDYTACLYFSGRIKKYETALAKVTKVWNDYIHPKCLELGVVPYNLRLVWGAQVLKEETIAYYRHCIEGDVPVGNCPSIEVEKIQNIASGMLQA